jgi:uncharacterized protein (TIGR00369 family)
MDQTRTSTFERDDFHGQLGITLLEWRDGFARIALALQRRHMNRSGILHGGVLLTMLDEVGALCGVWCSVAGNQRSSVTVDLDCRFVGQTAAGTVIGTGELVSHGRSLYFTRTQVTDEGGRVLAYGASSHKWRRGSEKLEGAPPS